jgi:hypothetical protein
MKVTCRSILKKKKKGKYHTLNKHVAVLELMTVLLEYKCENLIPGFQKCVIFSLDKQQLPVCLQQIYVSVDLIANAFFHHMEQNREHLST